jgi:RES domain-containing protein
LPDRLTLTVWRLVTARFADSAFSGEGARLYGGRWNRKGVPLVYTAQSQSLAMLEILVQDEPLRARYVMIPAHIPTQVKIERTALDALPADWRDLAARKQLQTIGSAWARNKSTAVLAVPGTVIPAETNYLLNPLHPDFSGIEIGEPQAFITDLRLIRK